MTTPSNEKSLEGLVEKVRQATGPDRDLDGAIEVQARRFDAYRAGLDDSTRAHWKHNGSTVYDGNTGYVATNFTASADAALALAERVLPGWDYSIENMHEDGCYGKVWKHGWHDDTFVAEHAPAAPLAILLAVLTALQSSEQSNAALSKSERTDG